MSFILDELICQILVEFVDYEAGTELGFEPCGLRRHDVAGVGDVDELVHGDWVEGEGHLHLTAVNTFLELFESTDAPNEVDALVAAEVGDAEDITEDKVAGNGHIEYADRVRVVECSGLSGQ